MGLIQDTLQEDFEKVGSVTTELEKEVVIYAKVGDAAGLEQALRTVFQEQAQIKTDTGSVRVRKTTEQGKPLLFEMTSKLKRSANGVQSMLEETVVITEEVFELFRRAAPAYMVKNRHYYKAEAVTVIDPHGVEKKLPLDDVYYEVDIFYKKDGSTAEWCKIDLEIQNLEPLFESAGIKLTDKKKLRIKLWGLPFRPTAVVVEDDSPDVHKRALIDELYESQFLIKNEHHKEGL